MIDKQSFSFVFTSKIGLDSKLKRRWTLTGIIRFFQNWPKSNLQSVFQTWEIFVYLTNNKQVIYRLPIGHVSIFLWSMMMFARKKRLWFDSRRFPSFPKLHYFLFQMLCSVVAFLAFVYHKPVNSFPQRIFRSHSKWYSSSLSRKCIKKLSASAVHSGINQ